MAAPKSGAIPVMILISVHKSLVKTPYRSVVDLVKVSHCSGYRCSRTNACSDRGSKPVLQKKEWGPRIWRSFQTLENTGIDAPWILVLKSATWILEPDLFGESMGCVYKLTSPSGKSYIGATKKTAELRFSKHKEHALGKRNAGALYSALRKYGPDTFKLEVLITSDNWEHLLRLERDFIRVHNTRPPHGYNVAEGGQGGNWIPSEQFRFNCSVGQKKRFQRPEERARLFKQLERANAANVQKRSALPADYAPPWIIRRRNRARLSKIEISRRIRKGMADPIVAEKVRQCAIQRAANPEWRAKISASKIGKPNPKTLEWRHRISEIRKSEWADPVMRAKRLAAFTKARTQGNLST